MADDKKGDRGEDQEGAREAVRRLLSWMGEDPDRSGLTTTPDRVVRSLARLTDGDGTHPHEIFADGSFPAEGSGLVLIRDIEFYSLCEHHLLPFFGHCHVAYLPSDEIIGFSRIPRLVNHFARRLQVQERLTGQVADALMAGIHPQGVACVVEAFHLCMAMRGVEKQQAMAVTSCYRGVFESEPQRRQELGDLLKARGGSGL
jgi:GTP cyclohydrolase I